MSASILILAHLGHWYVSLPIYLGPFLAIAIWLKWSSWRERRGERERAASEPKRGGRREPTTPRARSKRRATKS